MWCRIIRTFFAQNFIQASLILLYSLLPPFEFYTKCSEHKIKATFSTKKDIKIFDLIWFYLEYWLSTFIHMQFNDLKYLTSLQDAFILVLSTNCTNCHMTSVWLQMLSLDPKRIRHCVRCYQTVLPTLRKSWQTMSTKHWLLTMPSRES